MIRLASEEDISGIISLEECVFSKMPGYMPECEEGWRYFLRKGGAVYLLDGNEKTQAILAMIDPGNIDDSVKSLPPSSSLRKDYEMGNLNREGIWVYSFAGIGDSARWLYRILARECGMAFGFVFEGNTRAVRTFDRVFVRDGTVPNVHDPEKSNIVYVYRR